MNNLIFTQDILTHAINENNRYRLLTDNTPGIINFLFNFVDSIFQNVSAVYTLLLSFYIDIFGLPNIRLYKMIMKILTEFLIDESAGICIFNLRGVNYCQKNNSFLNLEKSYKYGIPKTINFIKYILFIYISTIIISIFKDIINYIIK